MNREIFVRIRPTLQCDNVHLKILYWFFHILFELARIRSNVLSICQFTFTHITTCFITNDVIISEWVCYLSSCFDRHLSLYFYYFLMSLVLVYWFYFILQGQVLWLRLKSNLKIIVQQTTATKFVCLFDGV
jgi:hypothetical protein